MYGALEDVIFHQKPVPMALHERKSWIKMYFKILSCGVGTKSVAWITCIGVLVLAR